MKQNLQIKYRHARVKTSIQLEIINGETLKIPLDKLCKVEVAKGKTTIHCIHYEN